MINRNTKRYFKNDTFKQIVSDDEGASDKKNPVKVKPSVEKEEGEMSSDGEGWFL